MGPVSLPSKRVTRGVVYLEEHLRSVTTRVGRVPGSSCKKPEVPFPLPENLSGTRDPGLRSRTGWELTPQILR